jgi:hypothetical protein
MTDSVKIVRKLLVSGMNGHLAKRASDLQRSIKCRKYDK